jgi:bifunctional ADP-heptose synthase (sugar kinase/adenylyltransferase)
MIPKDNIIVVTGTFDDLAIDDLRFLQKSRKSGNWLIVGLNSDIITHMITGNLLHDYDDRQEMLQGFKCVDEVMRFDDSDGTSCRLLKMVKLLYPQAVITYVSKYDMKNMPEAKIRGIKFQVID